jgi:hypothetical protein
MFTASGHSFMVSNPPPPLFSLTHRSHSGESLAGLEVGSVVKVSGVLTGMVVGASWEFSSLIEDRFLPDLDRMLVPIGNGSCIRNKYK